MVAKARKTDADRLRAPHTALAPSSANSVAFYDVSWDLYERLLRETAGQAVQMALKDGWISIEPPLLRGISWGLYEELLEVLNEKHVRTAYDRGTLEFMSPMPVHEKYKILLRILVEAAAKECGVALTGFGSMTCRKKLLERGLEPDECFYVGELAKTMWKRSDLDLEIDPVPDLALEVDNRNSSLDRQSIYEALGVSELWRFDGKTLKAFHCIKGKYSAKRHSLAFPKLSIKGIEEFIRTWDHYEASDDWVTAFRIWVRSELEK